MSQHHKFTFPWYGYLVLAVGAVYQFELAATDDIHLPGLPVLLPLVTHMVTPGYPHGYLLFQVLRASLSWQRQMRRQHSRPRVTRTVTPPACSVRGRSGPPPGFRVWLNMTDVDLESHGTCNYDSVTAYSSKNNNVASYGFKVLC